jgi:pheromone shutdown protein TraB
VLAAVGRGNRTVGGQPSTCLVVSGTVGRHVICMTATGIPTEVVVSGTRAVLTSLSPTVVAGELAQPAT